MKIHHAIEATAEDARPRVLAIGFFDGFHRGHREIVRTLLRLRRPGYRAAVLTFANHPATHLRPDKVPPLITTLEERVDLLAASGIDELFLLPFDERIASLGENFRFGSKRRGDATLAREQLGGRGVEVIAVPPLLDGDERVSSTRIRSAIERGDLSTADRLLGEPYTLRGTVVLGAGRGHDLGFPTANLDVPAGKTLPADGVYAAVARHDGRDYSALVSIGDNPTFGGGRKTVEVWLRDFQRTIYGEQLSVRDFRYIRAQRAFANVDELLQQMDDDATHVRFPTFSTT